MQDNGPVLNKRPMPHTTAGSPVDSKQMLNLQYNNPTRLYANSSADSALPAQMSGLHIAPAQR